jgi:hypothetical protein
MSRHGELMKPEVEAALVEQAWRLPWERARLERELRYQHWANAQPTPSSFHALLPPTKANRVPASRDVGQRHCLMEATILLVALRLYQADKGQLAKSLEPVIKAYLPYQPEDPFGKGPFRYRLSQGEKIVWPAEEPAVAQGGAGAAMPAGGAPMPPGGAPMPGGGPPGMPPPGAIDGAGAPPGGVPGVPAMPPAVEEDPTRTVHAGQGVLWSVGEDGADNGGKRRPRGYNPCEAGEDIIFVVPLPAKKR